MNSKALVLLLFAVWSVICVRWYVCGIKEACGDRKTTATPVVVPSPAIEPDTLATQPNNAPAKRPAPRPVDENNIGSVQLEELEDRMVIYFPYSSTRREDNDAIDNYLDRLAQHLKTNGGSVTITGHTDFVSDSKTNYAYGLRRANGIRDILVKKGVKKSQIKCKSAGESKPVATNDTAPGRYKNRRVEIRVSQ
jgi:outer membrane protein OmpA-like peptidoglycan-associated protein